MKKKFFVTEIGLFGSYARNEQNENSDIDFLVVFETNEKIFLYTKKYNSAEDFYKSQRDFDAAMMNFIVPGESVGKLSDNLTFDNQHIEWQKIYGFRNIVAHHYFGINVDVVWQIIQENFPKLKGNIQQILNKYKSL